MKRHHVHIALDEETHKKIKMYCIKEGKTIKSLVKELVLAKIK